MAAAVARSSRSAIVKMTRSPFIFFNYHCKRSFVLSLLLLIGLTSIFQQIEAKKPKVVTPSQKKKASIDYNKGVKFVLNIFLIIVIPTVLMFIWSIIKDPETPQVAKSLAASAKDNLFGYLSSGKKKKEKESE